MYELLIQFLLEGDSKDSIEGANLVLKEFNFPLLKNKSDLLQIENLQGGSRINILLFVLLAALGAKVRASNSWLSTNIKFWDFLSFTDARGVTHSFLESDKPQYLEPFDEPLPYYGPEDNITQRTRILFSDKVRRQRSQLVNYVPTTVLNTIEPYYEKQESGKELIYRYLQTFWSAIPFGVGYLNIPNPIPEFKASYPFVGFESTLSIPYPTYYTAVKVYLGEVNSKSIVGVDLSKDGNAVQLANFIIANAHGNGIEINTRDLRKEGKNLELLIGNTVYYSYRSVTNAPPVFFGQRDSQKILAALKNSANLRNLLGVIDTSQDVVPENFFLTGAAEFGFGQTEIENPKLGLPAPPLTRLSSSNLTKILFLFAWAAVALRIKSYFDYFLPPIQTRLSIQDAQRTQKMNYTDFCSMSLTDRANALRSGRFSSVG